MQLLPHHKLCPPTSEHAGGVLEAAHETSHVRPWFRARPQSCPASNRCLLIYMKSVDLTLFFPFGFCTNPAALALLFFSFGVTRQRNAVDVGRHPEEGVRRAWVQGRAGKEATAASPVGAPARAKGAVFLSFFLCVVVVLFIVFVRLMLAAGWSCASGVIRLVRRVL